MSGEDYNWHYIGNVRVLTSSVDGLRRVHAERSEAIGHVSRA